MKALLAIEAVRGAGNGVLISNVVGNSILANIWKHKLHNLQALPGRMENSMILAGASA
ncbi:MAG: hypothetical protein P4L36_02360 [Holophaga sp.]|nr:hypothetical protein [Holophaga sp.]